MLEYLFLFDLSNTAIDEWSVRAVLFGAVILLGRQYLGVRKKYDERTETLIENNTKITMLLASILDDSRDSRVDIKAAISSLREDILAQLIELKKEKNGR